MKYSKRGEPVGSDYAADWTERFSNPGSGKIFFFSSKRLDWLWGPLCLTFSGCWGCFPGVKRPVLEVTHSPPSNAEARMSGAVTILPLYITRNTLCA